MRRAFVVVFLLFIAALAISYGTRDFGSVEKCSVCNRAVHSPVRLIGESQGHRYVFCCLACAHSLRKQSGSPVRFRAIPDYFSGKPVTSTAGFVVAGSDVVPCSRHEPHMGENKQPVVLGFDRCEPSILAFSNRNEALAFMRQHGGRLRPVSDLVRELESAN